MEDEKKQAIMVVDETMAQAVLTKSKELEQGYPQLMDWLSVMGELANRAADELLKQAEGIAVADESGTHLATTLLSLHATANKKIDGFRHNLTDPWEKRKKDTIGVFTGALEKIAKGQRIIEQKLSKYTTAQRQLTQIKTSAALASSAAQMADTGEIAPIPAADVAPPAKSTRTEFGTTSVGERWTYAIKDEAKVPREYCDPSSKKINGAIAMGTRSIPGVDIFPVAKVTTRSKL